jgi:hypothetical protein
MCFCSAGDDSDGGYEDSDDGDGAISGVSESGNALPTDARGRGLLYFELVV